MINYPWENMEDYWEWRESSKETKYLLEKHSLEDTIREAFKNYDPGPKELTLYFTPSGYEHFQKEFHEGMKRYLEDYKKKLENDK